MYCYLYDEFLQDNKRFEKELLQIENRLTDLGIAGKISRLALFRNAQEMIRDEIDKGTQTVVVVGNDDTIRKVVDVLADSGVTFGIIPIGSKNELARLMGIPNGVAACDVLSARRVETIDVGTVNGRRFIIGATITNFRAEVTCEGAYRIFPKNVGELEIQNLSEQWNPCGGYLQTIIRAPSKSKWYSFKKRQGESVLPMQSFTIQSEKPMSLLADGEEITGTRFDIAIEKMVLKVIAGKERFF